MSDLERLIDNYCDGWSAESEEERERLIRSTLTADAIYTDPRANRLTVPELLRHIAQVQASRPGAKVTRTSNVDSHHGMARFNWCLLLPDGSRLPEGIDFVELNKEGTHIQKVVGFFGLLRPLTHGDA